MCATLLQFEGVVVKANAVISCAAAKSHSLNSTLSLLSEIFSFPVTKACALISLQSSNRGFKCAMSGACKKAFLLNGLNNPEILKLFSTIEEISNLSNDLIYAVSILGITGNNLGSRKELIKYLDRVKANSSCPFIVGFGIKTNDDVKWFNKYSNGAVVGSHILNHINVDEDYVLKANEIINSLSKSN